MTTLKLRLTDEIRDDAPWSGDDYDVVLVETGDAVGRIFRQRVAPGDPNEWFWGFALSYAIAAGGNPYGHAASKEAAKRAFADLWHCKRRT